MFGVLFRWEVGAKIDVDAWSRVRRLNEKEGSRAENASGIVYNSLDFIFNDHITDTLVYQHYTSK